jgi:hypothetical protein
MIPSLTLKKSTQKSKYRNCNKENNSKEKSENRTVPLRFCPCVENQKLGQFSQISIRYLHDSVCLTVWMLHNFNDQCHCQILFLDRTAVEQILTFGPQNPGGPEYYFCRQLSQLSDGPYNGSKRLAIYELRLSETPPVVESGNLGRLHLSA